MRHILVYGDSLSWGIIPGTRQRLTFIERWPGVLEAGLLDHGLPVRVTENCLNGRRTVWEDPFKPGRDGRQGLQQVIESQSPLDLVILLLGTNDFQFSTPHNEAWSAAQGVATLVNLIRTAPIEPGMPVPPVLLVAPPPMRTPRGLVGQKFQGAPQRSVGLAAAYREIATTLGCPYFDAGSAAVSSDGDGVHLDADQHAPLGQALVPVVASILARAS
ncbi:MAG: SGNH/GDSL hydrolase family protein [Acidobacteria bacterium]|nr:SGNH/GDSL hydrolase family protein [Acidobacteriota bacterium]